MKVMLFCLVLMRKSDCFVYMNYNLVVLLFGDEGSLNKDYS